MTRKERQRHLIRELLAEMLDDRGFRRLLRETVLMTLVEQRHYALIEEARGFLEACYDRRIKVKIDRDGKLSFDRPNALSAELRAMLVVRRDAIVTYLRSLDDLERYSQSEVSNGKAEGTTEQHSGRGQPTERTASGGAVTNGNPGQEEDRRQHRPGAHAGPAAG